MRSFPPKSCSGSMTANHTGGPTATTTVCVTRRSSHPEYGGDGKTIGRCATRELPLADYPAHWAPLGMTFYTGDAFGNKYKGGLFIAFHGSRFDPRLQPAGPGTTWCSSTGRTASRTGSSRSSQMASRAETRRQPARPTGRFGRGGAGRLALHLR
jgi:glucose/arabinose dehydrogenase